MYPDNVAAKSCRALRVSLEAEMLCQTLDWDSEFFGVRIARACTPHLTLDTIKSLIGECEAQAVQCLYFLANPEDANTVTLLENHGFGLKDVRLTLVNEAPASQRTGALDEVRPARPEDLPALRRIARESHRQSRFYFDFHFPRGRCDDLYDAWITNSCAGYADAVLVAERGEDAVGYITCSMVGARRGQIGLLAVAPTARGTGTGRRLIEASLGWFNKHGAADVIVVTQGRNVAAVRAYERCGFVAEAMQFWYHKWFTYF